MGKRTGKKQNLEEELKMERNTQGRRIDRRKNRQIYHTEQKKWTNRFGRGTDKWTNEEIDQAEEQNNGKQTKKTRKNTDRKK